MLCLLLYKHLWKIPPEGRCHHHPSHWTRGLCLHPGPPWWAQPLSPSQRNAWGELLTLRRDHWMARFFWWCIFVHFFLIFHETWQRDLRTVVKISAIESLARCLYSERCCGLNLPHEFVRLDSGNSFCQNSNRIFIWITCIDFKKIKVSLPAHYRTQNLDSFLLTAPKLPTPPHGQTNKWQKWDGKQLAYALQMLLDGKQ